MSKDVGFREAIEEARSVTRCNARKESRKAAKIVFDCQGRVLDGVLSVWDMAARMGRGAKQRGQ